MRKAAIALATLTLVGSACSGDDGAGDSSQPPGSTTEAARQVDYEPAFEPEACPAGTDPSVACGRLVVPEDRTDPDSPSVRLAVAIVPSRAEEPAPDPVVVLHGGPGGSLVGTSDNFVGNELGESRDVILMDQRGTGLSEPSLACPDQDVALGVDVVVSGLGAPTFHRRQNELLAACRRSIVERGVDPGAYDTVESAADVADLRTALGIDEWNIFSVSYGTRLALAVLRDHPEGVRSAVLDSVYPPEIDEVRDMADDLDHALGVLYEACRDQTGCSAAYPDLPQLWHELQLRLAEGPIEVTVAHPTTGEPLTVVIDDDLLSLVAFGALYDRDLIAVLPFFLDQLAQGQPDALAAALVANLAERQIPPALTQGAFFSGECADEIAYTEGATYDIEFGVADEESCATWDVPAGGLGNEPITSDVPTLVLAGAFDPVTPAAWSRAQADRMAEATYVEFPYFGHSIITSTEPGGCARQIRLTFFAAPEQRPDATCAADQAPIEFRAPG